MDIPDKEMLSIITSQGEIDIDEDDMATKSTNYSNLFYQQNPFKKINYSHPIQPMTFSFLKYYFDNAAGLNSNKNEEDPKKIYDLIKDKFWGDYEMETLKEVYMFLKEWEIDETLQRMIIKAIQKNENPEVIVSIYYFLIESHINVDIFEEDIIYPSFIEYFNILIKNDKISKENLYKIFKNCQIHFKKEEMNSTLREMFKTIGSDVLKILFPWINLKECSTENLMCMFDISSEENNIKNSENNAIKDINNNNSKEKNQNKHIIINGKNDENNNADQNKDLIGQLVSIIRRVMITNVKITEEKEKIKQMFIETEINEHSTDIELFHFHKNYLKNRYYYLNHLETEYNDFFNKNQSNGHKVQRTKDKFQYSKEMLERGMKFKISKIFLKLIEEEEEEKNIIQKCKSFLNSKDITLLSLFDLSLSLYEKENKRKFEIIADFVIQKVSTKGDFFLLKILAQKKTWKIYKRLSEENQIKKIIQECEKNQSKIKNIKIPKSAGKISLSAFSSCTSLRDVEIEDGIIEILYFAFSKCSSLKKIKIPKTVEIIGKKAFEDCIALTEIEIEEGVTTIDDGAFLGCSKLEKIKIPKSVKTIGRAAFSGCSSLTEVEIEDGTIKIDNGEITEFKSKKKYKLSDISKWLPLKEIEIEEGRVEICSCEFEEFRSLERIKIPKSVTKIGDHAFDGCSSLNKVEINEGVVSIGEGAFMSCSRLEEIKIPKSTVKMAKKAFLSCLLLKEVEIYEGVTCIDDATFYGCKSLLNVKIPKSVTKIGDLAFEQCSSLTEVEINEGVVSIGNGAFSFCESLKIIKIPKSIRTIDNGAFLYCTSLKEFVVPSNSPINIDEITLDVGTKRKISYY